MEMIDYLKINDQLDNKDTYGKMNGILEYIDSFNNLPDEKRYVLKLKTKKLKYCYIYDCALSSCAFRYATGVKNIKKYSMQDLAKLTVVNLNPFKNCDIIDTKTNKPITIEPAIKAYFVSYVPSNDLGSQSYSDYLHNKELMCPNPDFETEYFGVVTPLFSQPIMYYRSFLYKKSKFSINF